MTFFAAIIKLKIIGNMLKKPKTKNKIQININCFFLSKNHYDTNSYSFQKSLFIVRITSTKPVIYLISILPEYWPVTHWIKNRPAAIVQGMY